MLSGKRDKEALKGNKDLAASIRTGIRKRTLPNYAGDVRLKLGLGKVPQIHVLFSFFPKQIDQQQWLCIPTW